MNRIYNKKFDEVYYEEVLDNGLKVIINHKPEFTTSTCIFGTPYGALDIYQSVDGMKVVNNAGIAHFLEHKLFETEDKDVMEMFSALGCSVNAFTTYNETCYYFKTTNENIDVPLNLLLDFVQDLNIDEASVEKEKGIIIQEIKMYDQMPDSKLTNEAYRNMYHNFPLKFDIGGDEDSVNKITKNELESCYKRNYHPSQMLLVITSPVDPLHLIELIKNNQKNKDFEKKVDIKRLIFDEPEEVVNKEYDVKMDIKTNKVVYSFKFRHENLSPLEKSIREWALKLLFEMQFSSLNPNYERWLKDEVINDYFGFDVDYGKGYFYVMFYSENCDSKVFRKFIDNELKKINGKLLSEKKYSQLLRRYHGKSFDIFNSSDDLAIGLIRYHLDGLSYYEYVEELMNLSFSACLKIYNDLDFGNNSLVEIKNY